MGVEQGGEVGGGWTSPAKQWAEPVSDVVALFVFIYHDGSIPPPSPPDPEFPWVFPGNGC